MKFIDKVRIKVKGGNGGNGCVSFRREKYVPKGGPDGGDGGKGGNVIIKTTSHLQNLAPLKFRNHYDAGKGEHGKGKDRIGHGGEDLIILVPQGTLIKNVRNNLHIIADLDQENQEFIAARGGKGGRGNARFKTSVNQCPRNSEPGIEGEEKFFELELKLVGDVGLVGYPNAGKSTFLSAVSSAEPKIASYPFTTLSPQIGIVEFDDLSRLRIADIPGLVEGAHENIGLGHEFLRHVERTKILAFVLDMAGIDGREPWDDLNSLINELECYKKGLSRQPSVIIANKMDEKVAEEKLNILRTKSAIEIFPISAIIGTNVASVLNKFRALLDINDSG